MGVTVLVVNVKSATMGPLYIQLPYRMIKSRWLVGTVDLCTVEILHSSRVSKFWIFFEILDFFSKKSNILIKKITP